MRYNFCILSLSSRRPKRVDLSFVGARTRRNAQDGIVDGTGPWSPDLACHRGQTTRPGALVRVLRGFGALQSFVPTALLPDPWLVMAIIRVRLTLTCLISLPGRT